jgi:hypothetical protein
MKCVVCKQAETRAGTTTMTLQRGDSTFVSKTYPPGFDPTAEKRMSTTMWLRAYAWRRSWLAPARKSISGATLRSRSAGIASSASSCNLNELEHVSPRSLPRVGA